MIKPDIHCFEYKGKYFVLDINTCETMEINPATFHVLESYGVKNEDEIIKGLTYDYPEDALRDVFSEIAVLKDEGYFAPYKEVQYKPATDSWMQSSHPLEMVLLVSQECNMGCEYCFAGKGEYGQKGKMAEETAIRAVDYLLEKSEDMKQRLHINFFGGEPLLNFPVVKKTADYIGEISRKKGIHISMGITTNGTILNDEILECLKKHYITVLISLDGPKEIHNKWRKFRNGKGTYDTVVKNAQQMKEYLPKGLTARVTLTKESPPIAEISKHIKELGFINMIYSVMYDRPTCNGSDYRAYKDISMSERELKDFYVTTQNTLESIINKTNIGTLSDIDTDMVMRNMRHTDGCSPRRYFCHAGFSEIAVGIDGEIYPCQRFVDMPAFKLGDIWTGLDGEQFSGFYNGFEMHRKTCSKCWGRYICGRDCFRDAVKDDCYFHEPDGRACAIKLQGIERQIYLQSEIHERMPQLLESYLDPRRIK
jgi:radical SAM additional 4Fe4S-binding domain